jgi:hypothetical protein
VGAKTLRFIMNAVADERLRLFIYLFFLHSISLNFEMSRWKRLQDFWKLKFLSQVGKEILLKVVIQAIITYSMSVFSLSKTLCYDLNSMMLKF